MQSIQGLRTNFEKPETLKPVYDAISFIRNILLHFPIFESWNDIFISTEIANKMNNNRQGKIESFLNNYQGKDKYSFGTN